LNISISKVRLRHKLGKISALVIIVRLPAPKNSSKMSHKSLKALTRKIMSEEILSIRVQPHQAQRKI